jgi:hypothetical protein
MLPGHGRVHFCLWPAEVSGSYLDEDCQGKVGNMSGIHEWLRVGIVSFDIKGMNKISRTWI